MADLDPVILEQFGWLADLTDTEPMDAAALMARFAESSDVDPSYRSPDVSTRDELVSGDAIPRDVRVRIYEPERREADCAAFVWAHGGGFTAGTLEDREADGVSREISHRAGIVVISVDYTLADGSSVVYPRLHDEVGVVFAWVRSHASELGIDPDKISLGGASAGANLALAVSLEARDETRSLPASVVLAYPLLHRITPVPGEDGADLSVLPELLRIRQEFVDHMFSAYLGKAVASRPYASAENQSFAQLPPTLVIVSEYDDLRPSGEEFAREAKAAGVDVTHYLAEGTMHGHLSLTATVGETDRTLDRIVEFLRRA